MCSCWNNIKSIFIGLFGKKFMKKFIKKLPSFLYENLKLKCSYFRKKNQRNQTNLHTIFVSLFLKNKEGGNQMKWKFPYKVKKDIFWLTQFWQNIFQSSLFMWKISSFHCYCSVQSSMEIQPETWRGNVIGISNVAAKMIFSLIKAKCSL